MSSKQQQHHVLRRITRYSCPEDLLACLIELRQIKSAGGEIPLTDDELDQLLVMFKDSLHFNETPATETNKEGQSPS